MRDEPDIVKELREEEKLGKICSHMNNRFSAFTTLQESQNLEAEKTIFISGYKEKKAKKDLELGTPEEKYKTIFENYAIAITLADDKERIVSWNKYTEELLNMDEADLFMRPVSSLYPPEEWQRIRAEDVRKKGIKYKMETRMIKKGYGYIYVEISLCTLKGAEGKIVGSVGIIKDITEQKKIQRELAESEEKYRTIFDNSAVAITLTDDKERIISWNKYTEKLLDMSYEDLYLKPVFLLYPPEEWKKIRAENVRQKGMQHHLETKMYKKNNELIDVDISLSVLKDYNGRIVGSIGVIKDITEQKKIERALAYEHNLLQSLLDNIPDSIYFKDKKNRFIKVNKAKAMHSNVKTEDMIGKTDFDFLSDKVARSIDEDDYKIIETGKPIINKIEKIRDVDGVERWVSVTKIPRFDENGKVIGTMGISRDITDLKRADDEIRRSEKRYRNLFDTSIYPIVILDKKGFVSDINQCVTKLLGYTKKNLVGNNFVKSGIIKECDVTKILENFKKHMSNEKTKPFEVELVAKNGEVIPVEINANPLIEDNKILGDLLILRDLREKREREKIEKELVESEKKFREIFDASGDILLYLDVNGKILDINKVALNFLGLSKEKVVGKSFYDIEGIFSPDDIKRHREAIQGVIRGEKINDYECDLFTKGGVIYRFLFSNDVISTEEGDIKGILVKGKDVTQRQRAWDELVRLEERYRVLAETSADGVLTIDSLGRLTYVNPSFERMCGRRKSQILATSFRDYLSNDSIYVFQQAFIDIRKENKKIENIELELINAEGSSIPIEVNIAPLKKNDKFAGVVATIRDITERKRIEDELKKSERLKTEFMNIAAHELKSPVTPIKGYLDLIIQDKEASERVKNWARISLRNSERLLKLVSDILDVSRLDSDTMRFEMEKLDTGELLKEIAEDMKLAVTSKHLDFIVKIPKDLPSIMGDRNRLSQVFKNLLANAVKFTDNGSITLGAEEDKDHVKIYVEDTGIGISEDELHKIFNKFYQAYTGPDRKNEGVGLGLFICKEIISKHNGRIWAESKLGEGSKFIVRIPCIKRVNDL
ncbi:MAG: PAS domain S-box protein [Candidatus Thermoplasmatota archaeon]|jgi:PAS domain S-box-containing protein|nr:PAS domain S-box protein [Candidatus Thermoplasmatota archaeon]